MGNSDDSAKSKEDEKYIISIVHRLIEDNVTDVGSIVKYLLTHCHIKKIDYKILKEIENSLHLYNKSRNPAGIGDDVRAVSFGFFPEKEEIKQSSPLRGRWRKRRTLTH